MKLFRIFDISKQEYVTHTNEWVIDIDGHPISMYSNPESDPDLTMREDCVVEWNTGYSDRKGHEIYEGDVFFDTENKYAMVVIYKYNMWLLQIWGWGYQHPDVWGEVDELPMDDFDFDDLVIAGNYHHLGNEVYKGAEPDDSLLF